MSWVRLDDAVYDHRKLRAIPHRARWVWVAGLAYSSRNRLDGALPAYVLSAIEGHARDARALEDVGLWVPDGAGWQIHDYGVYQLTANGELSRKRSVAGRKGAQARWQLP